MKHLPAIAGALLGLPFVALGTMVLLHGMPMPELPPGTPASAFQEAFGPTGYMTFVKVLEVLGGLLIMIPRTRNIGLLVLGPILVNILAYHVFVMKGVGLFDPMLIVLCLLAAYLLWVERKVWAALTRCC
jgi:uncharacterized membrane protein YphA (DoxX/SURF4 family)